MIFTRLEHPPKAKSVARDRLAEGIALTLTQQSAYGQGSTRPEISFARH